MGICKCSRLDDGRPDIRPFHNPRSQHYCPDERSLSVEEQSRMVIFYLPLSERQGDLLVAVANDLSLYCNPFAREEDAHSASRGRNCPKNLVEHAFARK